MRIKKYANILLSLSIILPNLNTYSIANNEILDRYEILEGEHITTENSTEGKLHEIEIFGNTVQDSNNLNDIQGVGDLHMDESGNPILDKEGRKQYKINIASHNFDTTDVIFNQFNVDSDTSVPLIANRETPHSIEFVCDDLTDGVVLTDDQAFGFSINITNGNLIVENFNTDVGYFSVDLGPVKKDDVISIVYNTTYRVFKNGEFISDASWKFSTASNLVVKKSLSFLKINNTNIKENNVLNGLPQPNITTIILPTQLYSAGVSSDRLYWSDEKKKYVIEKNIGEYTFTGSETTAVINGWTTNTSTPFNVYVPSIKIKYNTTGSALYGYRVYLKGFHSKLHGELYFEDNGEYWVGYSSNQAGLTQTVRLRIPDTVSIQDCQNLIKGKTLLYPMNESIEIETNITSKIQVPIYEGSTFISSQNENGVNPTLKVKIDRLSEIAKEAVENAEINRLFDNISIARMYINMLPESSYKDELQTRLSEIFSEEITLEKESITANLDVYIKPVNSLSMTLSTNQVTFDDFSGIDAMEKLNAVNLTINSSLPYQLNSYLVSEIQNSDKSNSLDKSILKIRVNGDEDYKGFIDTTTPVTLTHKHTSSNYNVYGIDLKLETDLAHKADVYRTVLQFEAVQE